MRKNDYLLYSFSIAAIINYHRLHNSKQNPFIGFQFCGPEIQALYDSIEFSVQGFRR